MKVQELEKLTLDKGELTFEDASLQINEEARPQMWEIKATGVRADQLLDELLKEAEYLSVEVGVKNDKSYKGRCMVTTYEFDPSGAKLELAGNGELEEA